MHQWCSPPTPMAKKLISLRLAANVHKAAMKRYKKLGFRSLGEYVEALIRCDIDRNLEITVTHSDEGLKYEAVPKS